MLLDPCLPDFLPGRLVLERGKGRDYRELAGFHYAAGPPATWADVRVIRFLPDAPRLPADLMLDAAGRPSHLAAVAVLSWPVPSCSPRERFFGWTRHNRCELIRLANANLRTISRVVVHPQFRSLGLSTILVRSLCASCPTRFVEALARMGTVHPLFERAGMRRFASLSPDEPDYFILDRSNL